MKLLVCTANQPRHVALVTALHRAGHNVLIVVEPKTYCDVGTDGLRQYWAQVHAAEAAMFPDLVMPGPSLALRPGELSDATRLHRQLLAEPRWPVVFSSSYLRGPLADALIARGALNLHVGIAPEYRGSAPNAWAWLDGRRDLIGAQVQRLSRGLDAGEILAEYHASPILPPFVQGMDAVRGGIRLVVDLLAASRTRALDPVRLNDRARQLRYSRHEDFTEAVALQLLSLA